MRHVLPPLRPRVSPRRLLRRVLHATLAALALIIPPLLELVGLVALVAFGYLVWPPLALLLGGGILALGGYALGNRKEETP